MANLVTVARVVLVFIGIAFLYRFQRAAALAALVIVLAVILMDWLDGVVARARKSDTAAGAVMDILGDRIVENSLWIVFAHLRLVPVWVPLVVVVRGFVTDAFRSVALAHGKTPFGQRTMMTSRVGKLLVASRWSRAVYAVAKVAAFCFLILYFAFERTGSPPFLTDWGAAGAFLVMFGFGCVYLTVAMCVIRGVPVVVDGLRPVLAISRRTWRPQDVSRSVRQRRSRVP